MNRDEIKGKIDRAKGNVKETAGELTNDEELQAEGKVDRVAGQVREGFGKAKRKVGDAIDSVTDDEEEEEA